MKKFKTKNLLIAALAVICAVMLCCSVIFFGGIRVKKAQAQTSTAGELIIDEITLNGNGTPDSAGQVFNGARVEKLLGAIVGSTTGTTYNKAFEYVNGGSSVSYIQYASGVYVPAYKSARDIYNSLGKNIVVNFGGYEWTVTLVTTDRNGNLIATLWLTDLLKTSSGSTVYAGMGWATSQSSGGVASSQYPGNMYSTSEARVKALNAGGVIASSASTATPYAKSSASELADLTMTNAELGGATTSLTDFITQPQDVDYQYVLNSKAQYVKFGQNQGFAIISQNDALYSNSYISDASGTVSSGDSTDIAAPGSWHNLNKITGNALYNDWGADYLWLPASAEIGGLKNGINSYSIDYTGFWETTYYDGSNLEVTDQTKFNGEGDIITYTSYTDYMDYCWMRSGGYSDVGLYGGSALSATGKLGLALSARKFGIRPALHLNLKAVTDSVSTVKAPTVDNTTDTTKTTAWDDTTHDFNLYFETAKSAITKIEREDVGGTKTTLYSYTLPTSPSGTGTATPNVSNITCTLANNTSGAKLTLKEAGKYTVTVDLIDKNYQETDKKYVWDDKNDRVSRTITITITPKVFTKPAVATGDINGQEYTGKDITFTLTSPDTTGTGDWTKYIKVDGSLPADLTDNADGSYKASKVNDYKFKLKLNDEENTVWSDRGTWDASTWSGQKGGSTNELKLSVKARTLTTVLSNANNWSWSVGKSGVEVKLVITNFAQASDIDGTGPDGALKLKYYYANADGTGETAINSADVTETFDATTGTATIGGSPVVTGTLNVTVKMPTINTPNDAANPNYIFGVKPVTTSGMDANYTVSSNSAVKKFVIGTAVIDLDTLVWSYNEDGVASNQDLAQNGHLAYKKNTAGSSGVEYEPQIMLYREDSGGNVIYDYSDASKPVLRIVSYSSNGGSVQKASNVNLDTNGNVISYKTTVKIELVDVTNCQLKATGNPSHVRVNTTDNTAEIDFTWYIDRAKVDLSKVEYEYGWIDDTTGEVKWEGTYSDKSKPSFRDSNVSIRVKSGVNGSAYPDGITNAVINSSDYLTDRDAPGAVTAKVNYTLDPNYYYEDDNGTKYTGSFTANGGIELAKKKIPVSWVLDTLKDASGNEVLDDNGLPYQIYVLDFGSDPDNLAQYIKYEYYYADVSDPSNPVVDTLIPAVSSGTTTNAQLDYLIDVDGAGRFPAGGGTSTVAKPIFVRAVIDATVTGSDKYELNVAPGTQAEQYTKFGQKKNLVEVDVIKSEIEYGTAIANSDEVFTVKKGTATYSKAMYTAKIYAGTDDTTAVDVSTFDFSQANAGTYTVKLTLKPSAADSDALNKTSFEIEITAKEIELPQIVSKIEFNSSDIVFAEHLDAKYQEYLDAGIIAPVSGITTARDVAQSPYAAVIEIVNPNYKWKTPTTATPSKAIVKAVAADDEVTTNVAVDAASKEATYSWNIAPYRLPADLLNTSGKNGATINAAKLPEWARQLITDGTLSAGVKYYVDETCTEEVPVDENGNYILEKKKSYYAKPVIGAGETGDDSGNFTFATDGTITNTPSKAVTYKIPQSGAAAALGNIKDFMTKTWMGLPIWAWFLIGLAILILLIIIIVVAVKRRKTKEEREEKKAAKQAAKEEAAAKKAEAEAQREAERMRLESQREIEKMRAEAEAAKAKAEAEAEIAKMRAQAQAQMAQPMAMPQQMPQQMPMQQQYAQQPQMQQQMPQPVPQPQYVQQPVYGPMPQSGGDLAELKAEIRALKAEQNAKEFASMKSEFESMKMRMNIPQAQAQMPIQAPAAQMPAPAQGYAQYPATAQYAPPAQQLDDADMSQLAELIAITWRKAKTLQSAPVADKRTESRQVVQAETAPVTQPAVYPPDAVITTTTTVDTTKNSIKTQSKDESERDRFFDIDGFYDKFEG